MSNPLFVGIDISSKDNVVCCLTKDSKKHPISRFTVLNNRPGIMELKERICQLEQKYTFSEILFGLEHTGCYSTHAAMYLQRHLDFGCPDVRVYMFNPSLIALVFNNKLSATSLAVMEEFESIETLAEASVEELAEFLIEHGKNRFDDPHAVAMELKKAARSSYRLPKAMADSINLAMASSIRVIRTLQDQLKSLKKAISDHLGYYPSNPEHCPRHRPHLRFRNFG